MITGNLYTCYRLASKVEFLSFFSEYLFDIKLWFEGQARGRSLRALMNKYDAFEAARLTREFLIDFPGNIMD
jgi:hypothetical protein